MAYPCYSRKTDSPNRVFSGERQPSQTPGNTRVCIAEPSAKILHFGNQAALADTLQPPLKPRISLLKKVLLGVGFSAGIYYFGKSVTRKLSAAITRRITAQLSETLTSGGLKDVLETLKKTGANPQALTQLLQTAGGDTLLNLVKTEQGATLLKQAIRSSAGNRLPENAIQMLEQRLTPANLERLLDSGMLGGVMKYGNQLYKQNAGHLKAVISQNKDQITEQLAQLTGASHETIGQWLSYLE